MSFVSTLRVFAFKVALMAAKRQFEQILEMRKLADQLLVGIDPTTVDCESAEFRYGAFLALTTFLHAFESQTLSPKVKALLLKKHRARLMNGVLAYGHFGLNQGELGKKVGLPPSRCNDYIQELLEENLVEVVPLAGRGPGRTYQLTPWGRQVWQDLFAELPPTLVPPDQFRDAQMVAMGVLPEPSADMPSVEEASSSEVELQNALLLVASSLLGPEALALGKVEELSLGKVEHGLSWRDGPKPVTLPHLTADLTPVG